MITRPADEATCVKTKLMEYNNEKDAIFQMYNDILAKFDGDQNEDNLAVEIENFIVATLGAYVSSRS